MTDSETRIKVDISFNMTSGDSAATLIQVSIEHCWVNEKNHVNIVIDV